MYNVKVKLINNKQYYLTYDCEVGDIQCDTLPPYQDIQYAKACYLKDNMWIFDEEMYESIVKQEKTIVELPDTVDSIQAFIDETNLAIFEMAEMYETVITPLSKLAELLKGDE